MEGFGRFGLGVPHKMDCKFTIFEAKLDNSPLSAQAPLFSPEAANCLNSEALPFHNLSDAGQSCPILATSFWQPAVGAIVAMEMEIVARKHNFLDFFGSDFHLTFTVPPFWSRTASTVATWSLLFFAQYGPQLVTKNGTKSERLSFG